MGHRVLHGTGLDAEWIGEEAKKQREPPPKTQAFRPDAIRAALTSQSASLLLGLPRGCTNGSGTEGSGAHVGTAASKENSFFHRTADLNASEMTPRLPL